jgi:hypothetical protein
MDQQNAPIREITPGAVVTPPPAWADIEPYDAPAAANPHFVANGVCVLLDESQIDLVENERTGDGQYRRRAGGADFHQFRPCVRAA